MLSFFSSVEELDGDAGPKKRRESPRQRRGILGLSHGDGDDGIAHPEGDAPRPAPRPREGRRPHRSGQGSQR